jgi:hypothetical protein
MKKSIVIDEYDDLKFKKKSKAKNKIKPIITGILQYSKTPKSAIVINNVCIACNKKLKDEEEINLHMNDELHIKNDQLMIFF